MTPLAINNDAAPILAAFLLLSSSGIAMTPRYCSPWQPDATVTQISNTLPWRQSILCRIINAPATTAAPVTLQRIFIKYTFCFSTFTKAYNLHTFHRTNFTKYFVSYRVLHYSMLRVRLRALRVGEMHITETHHSTKYLLFLHSF